MLARIEVMTGGNVGLAQSRTLTSDLSYNDLVKEAQKSRGSRTQKCSACMKKWQYVAAKMIVSENRRRKANAQSLQANCRGIE